MDINLCTKKLFIFDLDGTLADCFTAITKSLNFTLKKLGYPKVSYYKAKNAVGRGDKNYIGNFFENKDIDAALKIYRKHHYKSLLKYSRLNPYAMYILNYLRKNNKIIAIASNRPAQFTEVILKRLRIKKYMDYILCAEKKDEMKPNPKMLNVIIKKYNVKKDEAVFIGDMAIDLEAAKRAKMDAVYIKGGSSPIKEVKKYKNKKIISSLKELILL